MITIIPAKIWATIALLIVAYVALGIPGVVVVALSAFFMRNL